MVKATYHPDFEFELNENGKCIVVTFSTLAYEMFKQILKGQYAKAMSKVKAFMKESLDNSNSTVDLLLKFTKRAHDEAINMFNTTFRMMVNGKHYKKFM